MNRLQKNQLDFINLRLGTFIHFNSATVQFHDSEIIDWEFDYENNGAPRRYPFDEKLWNPSELNCCQWADIAKSAGCRFAALTTKHHEGFALWPSEYSDHCVKNASCKRDVVKEFLEGYRKPEGQITELLTRYGEIPFLIVDGWNAPWGGPSYEMLPFEELDSLVKSLQPDCLFMNIGCSEGLEGTDVVFYENAAGQEADDSFAGPGVSCNKSTPLWRKRFRLWGRV